MGEVIAHMIMDTHMITTMGTHMITTTRTTTRMIIHMVMTMAIIIIPIRMRIIRWDRNP